MVSCGAARVKRMDNPLKSRRAGVLLHLTSLPGPQSCGSLGEQAFHWIDWLAEAGFGIWQFLPLTPVADGSPYNSYSAFAGNPQLIDLKQLQDLGLPASDNPATTPAGLLEALATLHGWFQTQHPQPLFQEWQAYCTDQDWLEDFCVFSVLKEQHPIAWTQWPVALRDRDPSAIKTFIEAHHDRIQFHRFVQFLFARQWQALRDHAHQRDVLLFGDIPIFVSHDSADVWCHRDLFKLDENGQPSVVAGVPPDYFSATGQRWGNPLYDWHRHRQEDFQWWQRRIDHALNLFDVVRIDHFRGFVAGWEIPAGEATAVNGRWVEAPGEALFEHLHRARPQLPLVAEDLGIITADVTALRRHYGLPGMKILQFAFDSDGANPYLPHHHTRNSVVYTGTHDNNTTLGWHRSLSEDIQQRIAEYYAQPQESMPWPLIRSALASPARWAIVPLQDLLALDAGHRMNTPGTTTDNWRWRFEWSQFDGDLATRMAHMNRLYQRRP